MDEMLLFEDEVAAEGEVAWVVVWGFLGAAAIATLCTIYAASGKKAPPTAAWPAQKEDTTSLQAVVSCFLAASPPAGRVEAAMAFNEHTNELILFGGLGAEGLLGDARVLSEMEWREIRSQEAAPGARAAHSMVILGSTLLVYGGVADDETVYALDLDSFEWFRPRLDGGKPAPRKDASLSRWGDRAVLFGGRSDAFLNDVWLLDAISDDCLRWTRLDVRLDAYVPPARDRHAAVVVADELVIFGGADASAGSLAPPGCVETLDLLACRWKLRQTVGPAPSPQPGLQAHQVGADDPTVCVVSTDSDGIFNQVFLLAGILDSRYPATWTRLTLDWQSDWTMVPGRHHAHASAASHSDGLIFLFGGHSGAGEPHDSMTVLDVADAAAARKKERIPPVV
ncbi:hypothetical protein CTAYLR_001020 [Chrysophaeum taylorii]|uniref:Uncharacterized protein n=1 Tax=Chrysophaeum taylorii TaxID=2483200 RepID=A0AAD7UFJ6_9STRA|nr:hypothetical protein CTAYLR_001020 [Chrysophaeum taylorii]